MVIYIEKTFRTISQVNTHRKQFGEHTNYDVYMQENVSTNYFATKRSVSCYKFIAVSVFAHKRPTVFKIMQKTVACNYTFHV